MKRPNNEYQIGIIDDYERNGENNFNTKFLHVYDALLDFSYQSITENGKFFNLYDENNRNLCYIPEKDFEDQLDLFMKLNTDRYKILVGFTGIGKTTLIKNYFGIRNRQPFIDKNNHLIAYKSFHSDRIGSENTNNGEEKIDTILKSFISNIIDTLVPDFDYMQLDWEDFGSYVQENKKEVINRTDKIPGYRANLIEELKKLCVEEPFEYYSCLLKYIMKKYDAERDLVLIFDDIESVNLKYHIPILEKIFSLNTCLTYNKKRAYSIKTIISMRGYTFRYNLFRQGEANRIALEDVIVKNNIPNLINLIEKRFSVIEKDEQIMERVNIRSQQSWSEAKRELISYITILDNYYETLLTGLTHNNISRTARLLLKIATNERWMNRNKDRDRNSEGKFIAKANDYISNNKEAVMKALIYGEGNVYLDYEDNILPNIFHNHYEERPGCDLLGLYLLTYYKRTNTSSDDRTILYGNTRIQGKIAIETIENAMCQKKKSEFHKKLEYIIQFLYNQGLLLHSIYEPEPINTDKILFERVYDPEYGLYLSSRAKVILKMLEKGSIIMEFYRDDIDTELLNNDKISTDLSQTDKFIYLQQLIMQWLDLESSFIQNAMSNIDEYIRCFGNNYIISGLIMGLLISFQKYYKTKDQDYLTVFDGMKQLMEHCFEAEREIDGIICFDKIIKTKWEEIMKDRNVQIFS